LALASATLALVSETPVIWLAQPPAATALPVALMMDENGCGAIAEIAPLRP